MEHEQLQLLLQEAENNLEHYAAEQEEHNRLWWEGYQKGIQAAIDALGFQ